MNQNRQNRNHLTELLRPLVRALLLALLALPLYLRWPGVLPLLAQPDCGVATTINPPVDTGFFRLVQAFGAPSPRHQGRYHTGDDWYGGRGSTYGQPVRAIAAGRVSYASPQGWGPDGGVVIIAHEFADGTTAYSMYGHLMESSTNPFPARLSCVRSGDIIGVIGDVRPAPHLHFEIRSSDGETPGPGYTTEDPRRSGWRQPSKFITNMRTWLLPAHQWHLMLGEPQAEAGPHVFPLVLNDNSMLYLDGQVLRRATRDGRVLWRNTLERPAVSITGFQGSPLLAYADGTMQVISIDGEPGTSWRLGHGLAGPPMAAGGWLIFPTDDEGLIAVAEDRRAILWELEEIPLYRSWYAASTANSFLLGLLTYDNELIVITHLGQVVSRVQLRDGASLADAGNGRLLAFTRGGLWEISSSGVWSLLREDLRGGGSSAVLRGDDGRLYIFDGQELMAYNNSGQRLWSTPLPGIGGLARLSEPGNVLLLTSTYGNMAVISRSGQVCGSAQIYGSDRSRQWHQLGSDGVLRLAVADQILGLDWPRFVGACGT